MTYTGLVDVCNADTAAVTQPSTMMMTAANNDISMDLDSLTLDDLITEGCSEITDTGTAGMHEQHVRRSRDVVQSHGYRNILTNAQSESYGCSSFDEGYVSTSLPLRFDPMIASYPETSRNLTDVSQRHGCFNVKDVFTKDGDGDTGLHLAIIHKDRDLAEQFINIAPNSSYLDISNSLLQTSLHLAAITRQGEITRRLIMSGAKVDCGDIGGNTPLHTACREGYVEIAQIILQSVFQITRQTCPEMLSARNYDGFTCLHLAARSSNLDILKLLIENGADINANDFTSGRTILHYAVETGNRTLLHFLLSQRNIDVCCQTYGGLTPLQLAAGRNYSDIVKLLISCGAFEDDILDGVS